MLEKSIPGVPGQDYPILAEVPDSAFTCEGQVDGGKGSFTNDVTKIATPKGTTNNLSENNDLTLMPCCNSP